MGKTGKTTGELTFDISQDEIKLGLDQAFRRVKKNLRVPGFRKGHVSRVILINTTVKKHYMKML